jgi:hypothetical protein
VLLRNCNGKLTQWMDTWHHEMRRANGESFHMSFLSFFRLHVRLFLNSFGIQAAMSPVSSRYPLFCDPRTDRQQVKPHNAQRSGIVSVLHKCQGKSTHCLARFRFDEHACRPFSALLSGLIFHTVPALRAGLNHGHDGIFCRFPVEGRVMIPILLRV